MLLLLAACIQAPPPPTVLVAADAAPFARVRMDDVAPQPGWPTAVPGDALLTVAETELDPVPDGVVRYVGWEDGLVTDDLVVGEDIDADTLYLYADPYAAWALADLVGGELDDADPFLRLSAFDAWERLAAVPEEERPIDPVEVFPVLLDEDGVEVAPGVGGVEAFAARLGAAAERFVEGERAGEGGGDPGEEGGAGGSLAQRVAAFSAESASLRRLAEEAARLSWVGVYRDGEDCVLLDLAGTYRTCDDLGAVRGEWAIAPGEVVLGDDTAPATTLPPTLHVDGAHLVRSGEAR